MYGSLDISTSALVANRTRMNTVAANLANAETLEDRFGNYQPFQRRDVVFQAGGPDGSPLGVRVSEITRSDAYRWVTPDTLPDETVEKARRAGFVDERGLVAVPDVDPIRQFVDGMSALRSYEANMTVVESTKQLMASALQIIA